MLGRCRSRAGGVLAVNKIPELLARLEKWNALGRNFNFFAGLRIAAGATATLTAAEAAKTANLDLVVLLEGLDDAFENRFNHGFGFPARQFGNANHFLDQISLGDRSIAGFRLTRNASHRAASPPVAIISV